MTLLLATLIGCGPYTVEDWWIDQADGFCQCNYPETYDDCLARQLASYEESTFWESCYDDEAPVERAEVRAWYRDYKENCQLPSRDEPSPEDPEWFQECEG